MKKRDSFKMETGVKKKGIINIRSLDRNNFTISLINQSYLAGLIDLDKVNELHNQILLILKDSILKYTKGKSSSIKIEKAQNILKSILYNIDAGIMKWLNSDDEIDILLKKSMIELYTNGSEAVFLCNSESKRLYKKIQKGKMDVGNIAYNYTIDEALPEFFDNYDEAFEAHETMCSIDYPLLFDDMSIQGIFYIKQYLEKLAIEEEFCGKFNVEDIKKLLLNYGKTYDIDYQDALINIFEILLTNSIFSVLANSGANELSISKEQNKLLREKFNGLTPELISKSIEAALEQVIIELGFNNSTQCNYAKKFIPILIPRFISAHKNDNLNNVIIVDAMEKRHIDMLFELGDKIDDEAFRILINQIMECCNVDEKIQLINTSITSLIDFIDVLEADCLFETEFESLFNALGDMELSILARIVYIEEIRSNPNGFSLQDIAQDVEDVEWKQAFRMFVNKLSWVRVESILRNLKISIQPTIS